MPRREEDALFHPRLIDPFASPVRPTVPFRSSFLLFLLRGETTVIGKRSIQLGCTLEEG